MIAGLLMAGGIVLFITGLVLYNEPLDTDAEKVSATPTAEPEAPKKTMRFAKGEKVGLGDLLFFDFPNESRVQSRRFEVGQLANAWVADFIAMYPHKVRAEFYVIIIPENANAYAVSKYVAHNYQKLREDQGPAEPRLDRRPLVEAAKKRLRNPEELMQHYLGEKLPFTGQIYIYHGPPLSDAQIEELTDLYRREGVVVEFRGPEYIAQMWADHGPREE